MSFLLDNPQSRLDVASWQVLRIRLFSLMVGGFGKFLNNGFHHGQWLNPFKLAFKVCLMWILLLLAAE